MADDRALRLAQNEGIMRQVNERIEEIAENLGADDTHLYDFVCECSRLDCLDRMALTIDEYTHVRERGERFALVAGHETPDIERVTERNERYWVVEKIGEAAEAARELDPRAE